MRIHFALNHGGGPEGKLADVEVHFEEGIMEGLRLVGCSVWRGKKGDGPSVLVPSRSYATAGGVRYYELIRPSVETAGDEGAAGKAARKRFIEFIRDEYLRITGEAKGSSGKVKDATVCIDNEAVPF